MAYPPSQMVYSTLPVPRDGLFLGLHFPPVPAGVVHSGGGRGCGSLRKPGCVLPRGPETDNRTRAVEGVPECCVEKGELRFALPRWQGWPRVPAGTGCHELPLGGAGGVGGRPPDRGGHACRAAHHPPPPQHRQVPLQEGGDLLHRDGGDAGRGLRLHRLHLRQGLLRGAGPSAEKGCRGVQGRPPELWQRGRRADLPGVLPEEEVTLALLRRVHPLGGVDHQGQCGEPGQRAGAADLPGEGRREALREADQHCGGDEQARVPAQDAHPVGGGQRLRHGPEGRAALPLQGLLPDHRLPGLLCHHHHAAAYQRHAGSVGPGASQGSSTFLLPSDGLRQASWQVVVSERLPGQASAQTPLCHLDSSGGSFLRAGLGPAPNRASLCVGLT